jgi:hypothetical protein
LISGSHVRGQEHSNILGCDVALSELFRRFRRTSCSQPPFCFVYTENGDIRFLWNVYTHLPHYTASRHGRYLLPLCMLHWNYIHHIGSSDWQKGKGKVLPRTGHEGPEGEQKYSSTLSLTSTLDEGGWSTPRPGRFTPGKETRFPLYRRLGGPQGRSRRLGKISPPPGCFFVLFKSFSSFMSLYVPWYRPYTTNTTQTSMPPVGFEPTIPVSERPQIRSPDRPSCSESLYGLSYPGPLTDRALP